MELIFLGTASNNPTPERSVSCTCLRYDGEVWLFDCGEATQIQLMKSTIKASRITKIFITHLHGDHIFGLPGLLCTISQNVDQTPINKQKPLEIYGPVGIRRYIRTNLELSRSLVTYTYIVHELMPKDEQIPDDIRKWCICESMDESTHPSEQLGLNINANESNIWNLIDTQKYSVRASWIRHRVVTFGFVIEQKASKGKLDVEALNKKGLVAGPLYAQLKSNEKVVLPTGEILLSKDFLGEDKKGKKIALLGDCYEVSQDMINLSMHSDVCIHECTLEDSMREKAIQNGHSTPSMASDYANRIQSKCLILNHFSQRYKPIQCTLNVQNEESVEKLLCEAKSTFKGTQIYAAYDLFTYKIL